MEFADSLKRFRKDFHLTQKQVAEAIGMAESGYQRYEQGRAMPSVAVLLKLANTFDVSADYLLGRTDVPNPNAPQVAVEPSVVEEIRRSAIAEIDRQLALKFPRTRTNFTVAMRGA